MCVLKWENSLETKNTSISLSLNKFCHSMLSN